MPNFLKTPRRQLKLLKKCKCVKAKEDEVLLSPEVLERLQEAKTQIAKKEKSSKKCHKDLVDVMIVNDHEELEGNEISQEENDTTCSSCGNYGKHYTKKGTWLICNTCDY